MRYVIAGGGAYGDHYVHKLLEGIDLGKVELDEIIVVDRDADCRVAQTAAGEPMVRLEVTDWRSFASEVWADPAAWEQDIWIPAPIAPHILADWVIDRVENLTGAEVSADAATPVELPALPFAMQHTDGRI